MSKAYREWKRHEKELREAFNAAHIPITLAEYKKQRRRISKARRLEIKRFQMHEINGDKNVLRYIALFWPVHMWL